jgi:methionine-rich copper-binding protein CopC
MSFRKLFAGAAALAVLGASLALTGVVSAHAVITDVEWDNPASPHKVIATSGEDEISSDPGSFYLKVYDVHGTEVDLGDAAVSESNPLQMSVSVPTNLAPGSYRVDWMTTSADDGDEANDSLTLLLPQIAAATPTAAAAAPAATATTAPQTPPLVAPPATGDAGLAAPHTSSNSLLELAAAGLLSLALIGGGLVFVAQRRR